MRGQVDGAGRALLTLSIKPVAGSDSVELVVWVDTAFDGELVVPLNAIHDLELPQSAAVQATLADGTAVVLDTFDCEIAWLVNGGESKSSPTKGVFRCSESACCEVANLQSIMRLMSWN